MFKISARTVIELGSELISSDTIAFYELIKNAFDARSKNGVEIRFKVVLRRNSYLRIYAKATSIAASEVYQNGSRKEQAATTGVLLDSALSQLDPAAGPELVKTFRENIGTPKTIDAFIDPKSGEIWTAQGGEADSSLSPTSSWFYFVRFHYTLTPIG